MTLVTVTKIISGGQTGADRGGLDFAIANNIEHGGWCPLGRRAQDGVVPAKYNLTEAKRADYAHRTKLNVRDSDGTVVFTTDPPGRGSAVTIQSCLDFGKPYLVITKAESILGAALSLLGFIRRNGIKTLNVAGSRAPDFHAYVLMVLKAALRESGFILDALKEDPKRFLQEVKTGIGPAQNSTGAEWIDFKDDRDFPVKVQVHNNEHLWIIPGIGGDGRLQLNRGQARRLANTLERWAEFGDLGKGFEKEY